MQYTPAASIRTRELTRKFGDLVAVDELDLELPARGVVGFVGPNGSGKSTTIRMLLGLIKPTYGDAEVLGQPIGHPERYADRVGALIENPAFVPGISGRSNVEAMALLRVVPPSRVDEAIALVGLTESAERKVSEYSLGMKQRLAIAIAILPDPDLLILDEPANGLDPAGIVEVRGLIRRLADEGRSVIVSSHLLSEIEAAADHLVVIRYGELLFSGPLAELLEEAQRYVDVEPEDPSQLEALAERYRAEGLDIEPENGGYRVLSDPSRSGHLNQIAADAGILLRRVVPRSETLEDVFLRMTAGIATRRRPGRRRDMGTQTTPQVDPPEAMGAADRRSRTPSLWRRILGISRAEGKRLTRRSFAGVGFGVIALFTLMATLVTFLAGDVRPDLGPMGGAVTDLASSDGLVAGLSAAADMIGIVILALWAAAVSSDYSTGWIRVMVQAEPRRWRLVAGKLVTLIGFTLAATTLATVISVAFAPQMAGASDISTAAWFDDAVVTVLGAWFDLTVVVLVWGTIGFAVAMLTRSAIVAIAGGIGYLMVFEGLLRRVAEDLTTYLPGSVLDAVAAGGNAVLGYGPALVLAVLFAVIAMAISTFVFNRRDVTS